MDTTDSPALHAAVLAAGPATRFGSPKQLVRLGGSLLVHEAAARAEAEDLCARFLTNPVIEDATVTLHEAASV